MKSKFNPTNRRTMSEIEFCTWLGDAFPDDKLEYHIGFLALDLVPDAGRMPEPERRRLKQLSERAMWSFEVGLVHLVQVRRGPEQFSYIAIARPKRQANRVALVAASAAREAA